MSLKDSEIDYIEGILNRKMNSLEEGMLDVMFSEHCSYKSSKPILNIFPTEGENILLGPGDDAGLISITEKYALAVGMESHNHPSAVEPYGGAGTGIGGILRDIISMGAMPIALLDSLRFGPLTDEKSRYLFEHVVKGISDYGNRVGIPTVAGETEFDQSYSANPLINVMCVGLVEKDKIVKGEAPNIGDVFLLIGGTTGRDGIHGVTFASEELTSDSETKDRSSVQVADPFTKKRVLETSLEILEKINVSGVKDLGGGGITCCISELVDTSQNGAIVYLQSIPLREKEMTPYEIMLSESQERMIFVIKPQDVELAKKICDKHEIKSSVIGEVIEGNNMKINDNGKIIADLPTTLLADPPSIDRPLKEIVEEDIELKIEPVDTREAILNVLSSPNIASKSWIYRQYDHEVQLRTVVKPGDDAAVLRIDDETAIALTTDSNTIHTKLSAYHGGAGSVSEAISNLISMGATPYAIVDCLNFGNPETPEILWQFKQCIQGMSDVSSKFNVPVAGGNVSFYNETEGIKINPAPVVGAIGVENIKNIRTLDFKNIGDKIILIGETFDEIGGSEFLKTIYGLEKGNAPRVRIDTEYANGSAVLNLIDEDINKDITAVHDVSNGGIVIALAEMVIKSGIGCEIATSNINVDNEIDINNLLFSETHGRYILTVKSNVADKILNKLEVPASIIGEVGGNCLSIDDFKITKDELLDCYNNVIEQYME